MSAPGSQAKTGGNGPPGASPERPPDAAAASAGVPGSGRRGPAPPGAAAAGRVAADARKAGSGAGVAGPAGLDGIAQPGIAQPGAGLDATELGSAGLRGGNEPAGPAWVTATARLARIGLATLPTPLIPAPRLAGAMGLESLHVKRDDLTGFALGGNKARPLEFLVAAACAQGADTLVTGGAAESNFCAVAAAAARRAGLACQLVIAGQPPQHYPGLDLACSWGARVTWTRTAARASVDAALPRVAAELSAAGRRPYVIPRGGATALGAVGYAVAAAELYDQLAGRGLRADCVLVAVGSGGTLAGLLAGNVLLGRPWRLLGAAVSRPAAETARRVRRLAGDCLLLLAGPGGAAGGRGMAGQQAAGLVTGGPAAAGGPGVRLAVTAGDVELADVRGPGHSVPSAAGNRAADTALRTEGLVADPVYTAKALAALPGMAAGRSAVFWHTGGLLGAIAAVRRAADDA